VSVLVAPEDELVPKLKRLRWKSENGRYPLLSMRAIVPVLSGSMCFRGVTEPHIAASAAPLERRPRRRHLGQA
jgi:hypothetical protein